jgi:hypothetical protein
MLHLLALQVTCGSTIKLKNAKLKAYLHSHEVTYGSSGSGQQSVTGKWLSHGQPDALNSSGVLDVYTAGESCSTKYSYRLFLVQVWVMEIVQEVTGRFWEVR